MRFSILPPWLKPHFMCCVIFSKYGCLSFTFYIVAPSYSSSVLYHHRSTSIPIAMSSLTSSQYDQLLSITTEAMTSVFGNTPNEFQSHTIPRLLAMRLFGNIPYHTSSFGHASLWKHAFVLSSSSRYNNNNKPSSQDKDDDTMDESSNTTTVITTVTNHQ